jgi:hypothetical protein
MSGSSQEFAKEQLQYKTGAAAITQDRNQEATRAEGEVLKGRAHFTRLRP